MLFMVIERFSKQNLQPMADRFKQHGRMLPEGVTYVASWMEINGTSCYQIMDAVDYPALERWLSRWSTLLPYFAFSSFAEGIDLGAVEGHYGKLIARAGQGGPEGKPDGS